MTKMAFKKGDRIRTDEYGDGEVIWADKECFNYLIKFDDYHEDLVEYGNLISHGHGFILHEFFAKQFATLIPKKKKKQKYKISKHCWSWITDNPRGDNAVVAGVWGEKSGFKVYDQYGEKELIFLEGKPVRFSTRKEALRAFRVFMEENDA